MQVLPGQRQRGEGAGEGGGIASRLVRSELSGFPEIKVSEARSLSALPGPKAGK